MGDHHGSGFIEIADGCHVARYAAWDTTIGAVVGSDGVLVVDTRATTAHGRQIRDDVARIAPGTPIRWVVNTHEHFDHVLGNAAFEGAEIHAHEVAAERMPAAVEHFRALIREEQASADPAGEPADGPVDAQVLADVLGSEVRLPDRVFSSVATIDLGDRGVELMHPGRGHTGGDIAIRVPDADVVFAGDLIEESGPPYYADDSFPLEWAQTLDTVMGLLTPASVVVPGHGAVVDRGFVDRQRSAASEVAELIRSLHGQGVPVDDALAAGGDDWPYPAAHLAVAVRIGYEQLAAAGAAPGSRPASPPPGSAPLPLS